MAKQIYIPVNRQKGNTTDFTEDQLYLLVPEEKEQDLSEYALLKDLETLQKTNETVVFDKKSIYGTFEIPISTLIVLDNTNAKIGVVQKMYHNSATSPFPITNAVKIGNESYVTGVVNIIYFEYTSPTRIEYWVTQA